MSVKANRKKQVIPTYVPADAIKLPMFFEHKPYQGASGRLYPLPFSDSISDDKKEVDNIKKLIDEDFMTTGDVDVKIDALKDWVDDNYCSKNVNGDIDLTRYALVDDVNNAFNELASALRGV